jgi:hypothetical protein
MLRHCLNLHKTVLRFGGPAWDTQQIIQYQLNAHVHVYSSLALSATQAKGPTAVDDKDSEDESEPNLVAANTMVNRLASGRVPGHKTHTVIYEACLFRVQM